MSSEEEATAANVLSQMSQIQQISCETIEATVINVGHHCDVETTATQGHFITSTVLGFRLECVAFKFISFLLTVCHIITQASKGMLKS